MSDFFADKTYQNLDWISQAVEPWEWDYIPAFTSFPEKIEITTTLLKEANTENGKLSKYFRGLTIEGTVTAYARMAGNDLQTLSTNNNYSAEMIFGFFKFEIENDTELDGETLEFTKPVYLVKTQKMLDDELCRRYLVRFASDKLYYQISPRDHGEAARMGEVIDLMCSKKIPRGANHKRNQLIAEIQAVFSEDRWRIRSMPLGQKLVGWIADYVVNGNLASMANFAQLKVMTHSGNPIYSINEVE